MIAHEQIKKLIKSATLPPVIVLAGSERALMDEALQAIRSYAQTFDKDGLNHNRFVAQQDKLETIINSLKTVPFLAPSRLIELHDAEKITAQDAAKIIEYIQQPSSFAFFVIVFNKIDKRNKLLSFCEEKKIIYICEPLSEKDTIQYIKSYAQDLGLELNHESALFLQLSLESDMLAIKAALDKLALVFEQKSLRVDDIAEHVVGEGSMDVFYLARLFSEGSLKEALIQLGIVRQKQENALKFLGVLVWQLRVLVHIRDCLDRGLAEWDIRKEVGVFGERFNWMLNVAKKRTITFHMNRLLRLLQCDIFLKSQRTLDPFIIIEKTLYQSVL